MNDYRFQSACGILCGRMPTLEQRIETLESSKRRQRWAIAGMATLTLVTLIGTCVVTGAKVAEFEQITCKQWSVIDGSGNTRICAATGPGGQAFVQWFDRDGKLRLIASTSSDGLAGIGWIDPSGNTRIESSTAAEGAAALYLADREGKLRIMSATSLDGQAAFQVFDQVGRARINSITFPNGVVIYPSAGVN